MGMMPLGLTEFDGMIRSELIAEIERLRAELYMRDKMELHEVVMKLVGPVMPVGETREDERRLENMKALTELADRLLLEIDVVSHSADRVEASMKAIGVHARDFMMAVKDA